MNRSWRVGIETFLRVSVLSADSEVVVVDIYGQGYKGLLEVTTGGNLYWDWRKTTSEPASWNR